jgi:GNAT superfamily N-acetyltransferase
MRVIDLTEELTPLYLVCLEDWSEEAREAGDARERWFRRARDLGLRVKLALDDEGRAGGMIQYLPIEHAPALGQGLHFILCIWVHGHRQGRGDFQGRGMGSALLRAAEEDARALGASGMAAWGLALPVWMRASWFRRHGYRKADRQGLSSLVWKPFTPDARPPRWLPSTGKRPDPVPGKVVVTACSSGWCMAMNLAMERARKAARRFGERAEFHLVDTSEREALLAWGQADSVWVDGREVRTGPPPSQERLVRLVGRRVARLRAPA